MIADPAGSFAASLAIDAATSADITPSSASRSAASAPNPGATIRGASINPVQKRTGSASASSHDSQDVTPGGLAAAQLDSSTLLPAPADPTTTVRRLAAPAVSRSCSTDLVTSVEGSVVGRNFVSANRVARQPPRSAVALSATTPLPPVPLIRKQKFKLTGHRALREGTKVTRLSRAGDALVPGHPRGGDDADPAARHAGGMPNQQTARPNRGAITDIRDHVQRPGGHRTTRRIRRLRGHHWPGHDDPSRRAARSGSPLRAPAADHRPQA